MEQQALVPYTDMSLQDTMTLGQTLAQSGYFEDARQAAQAVVKILAGRELGFGPIASMTGVSVIHGKVAIGANLMAAAIKRDPRYDYRVVEMSEARCELAFFEQGAEIGRSTFTIEEARAAGVGSVKPPGKPASMLVMFPRNMLFARAISNGMRWYCPDASGGAPIYTPEELGAVVNADGEIVNVTSTEVIAPPEPELPNATHWIDRVTPDGQPIRTRFWTWAKTEMGLAESDVHAALGVERVHDFTGTMQDAKDRIYQYIDTQIGVPEDVEPELAEAA